MIDITSTHFLVFACTLVLLILKAQALAIATALARKSRMTFILPEDVEWLGGELASPDHPEVRRIFRAHQNDLEALVPFAIGGLLYLASSAAEIVGITYFIVFAAARVLHGFAYLAHRPALRRNAFATSWLMNVVIAVHAFAAVLSAGS